MSESIDTEHKVILAGTGIKSLSHITKETEIAVQKASKVLYLVNEPIIEDWIIKEARNSESMYDLYIENDSRNKNYALIIEKILEEHKRYKNLCVLIYGHPTVFAFPGLEAIKRIEAKGSFAKVMPGISSEDCLFADLRINPGSRGCISLEATEFLLYDRAIDPSYHVIFWQIGQIGNTGLPEAGLNRRVLSCFCERVQSIYAGDVDVILYEASLYPNIPAKISKQKISELASMEINTISSLYLPPTREMKEDKTIRDMLS